MKTVGANRNSSAGRSMKKKVSVPLDLADQSVGESGERAFGGVKGSQIVPSAMRESAELGIGRNRGVERGGAEIKRGGSVAVADMCYYIIESFVFQVTTKGEGETANNTVRDRIESKTAADPDKNHGPDYTEREDPLGHVTSNDNY